MIILFFNTVNVQPLRHETKAQKKGDAMSAEPAQKYDFEVGVYRPPVKGAAPLYCCA